MAVADGGVGVAVADGGPAAFATGEGATGVAVAGGGVTLAEGLQALTRQRRARVSSGCKRCFSTLPPKSIHFNAGVLP